MTRAGELIVKSAMQEPEKLPSLEALGDRLSQMRTKAQVQPGDASTASAQGNAAGLQVGMELVCGVAAGLGLGVLLDTWLGTSPLFLVICFLLGTAGGFLTIYRTMNSATVNDTQTINESDEKRE